MPVMYLVQSNRPPYEAAAELLATLAFPHPTEKDQARDAAERLSAYLLRLASDQSHPSLDLRLAKERHAVLAEQPISLGKRLEQRLLTLQRAASIAAPEIAQRLGADVRVKGVDRVTHGTLVAFAVNAGWYYDKSDFRDRAWRLALPVLHMAVALYETQRRHARTGLEMDHLTLFFDPTIVREAINWARVFEPVVRDLWGDQFDIENQWRFRLIA